MKKLALHVAVLCLSLFVCASAQQLPENPSPQNERAFLFLSIVQAGISVADYEVSANHLAHGSLEQNPYFGHHPSRTRFYGTGLPLEAGIAYVGWRLKHARGWKQKIWFLPQTAEIGLHVWALVVSD